MPTRAEGTNQQVGFQCIWIYAWIWDNSNRQCDIHYTKLHKYGGWRTWTTNIRSYVVAFVVVVVVVVWRFCLHKWTSLIISRQIIRPNILKFQLTHGVINFGWPIWILERDGDLQSANIHKEPRTQKILFHIDLEFNGTQSTNSGSLILY